VGILRIGAFRPFRGVPVLGLFWDLGFFGYKGFLRIGVFRDMAFSGVQAVFRHNLGFRHFVGIGGF
jgi:hypothetical protein